MAERMGFEPMKEFPLHAFQACAFNHSATSPLIYFDTHKSKIPNLEY